MSRIERLKKNLFDIDLNDWNRVPLTILDEKGIEKEPVIIRKAKAIEKSISEAKVIIRPDELIVGSALLTWRECAYATQEEKEKYIGRALCNHMLRGQVSISATTEELLQYVEETDLAKTRAIEYFTWGHTILGFRRILQKGFMGVLEEAKEKLMQWEMASEKDYRKRNFWQAEVILCSAISKFAKRYADTVKA